MNYRGSPQESRSATMGLSGLSSSERDMQRANAVGFAWKPTNLFCPVRSEHGEDRIALRYAIAYLLPTTQVLLPNRYQICRIVGV